MILFIYAADLIIFVEIGGLVAIGAALVDRSWLPEAYRLWNLYRSTPDERSAAFWRHLSL